MDVERKTALTEYVHTQVDVRMFGLKVHLKMRKRGLNLFQELQHLVPIDALRHHLPLLTFGNRNRRSRSQPLVNVNLYQTQD